MNGKSSFVYANVGKQVDQRSRYALVVVRHDLRCPLYCINLLYGIFTFVILFIILLLQLSYLLRHDLADRLRVPIFSDLWVKTIALCIALKKDSAISNFVPCS